MKLSGSPPPVESAVRRHPPPHIGLYSSPDVLHSLFFLGRIYCILWQVICSSFIIILYYQVILMEIMHSFTW